MSKFKIGDRVVIVRCPKNLSLLGVVTEVTSALVPFDGLSSVTKQGELVHELAHAVSGNRTLAMKPDWLELYRPDHNEKLSTTDEPLSSLLPRTIRDLCSAGTAERAKRKAGV